MVLAHCRVMVLVFAGSYVVCHLDDVLLSQDVWLWLYFIRGLVSGWSRFRVRVLAHCRVMVLVFAGS